MKARDWQDRYYDGDDLFDPETPVLPLDDDLGMWDDEEYIIWLSLEEDDAT